MKARRLPQEIGNEQTTRMTKYNKGTAADARKTFIAKLKRVLKKVEATETKMVLGGLLEWLREQQARCEKKPGGVGRT